MGLLQHGAPPPSAAQAEPGPRAEALGSWQVLLEDHPRKCVLHCSERKCDFYRKIYSIWKNGLTDHRRIMYSEQMKFICHALKPHGLLGKPLLPGLSVKEKQAAV